MSREVPQISDPSDGIELRLTQANAGDKLIFSTSALGTVRTISAQVRKTWGDIFSELENGGLISIQTIPQDQQNPRRIVVTKIGDFNQI